MIGIGLAAQAAELVGWGGLYFHLKRQTAKRILIHGNRPQPSKIPIVDGQLRHLAGNPSKVNKLLAERVVSISRRLVNTRAFEYLLIGVFNKRSKLHPHLKKTPKVHVL